MGIPFHRSDLGKYKMSASEQDACVMFVFHFCHYKYQSMKRLESSRVFELKRSFLTPENKHHWLVYKTLKSDMSNFICKNPDNRQPFTLFSLRLLHDNYLQQKHKLSWVDNFNWHTLFSTATFACMTGFRASEITAKTIEDADDIRTLRLENIHFFRSSAKITHKEETVPAAENDRSILKSKLGIDNFCIPTNDRKSVLEIA